MALIRGVHAEQCLNCVHVLDLAGELLWVATFSCARSPSFAIIVLLSTVNIHGIMDLFQLSSHSLFALLRPCFRSLIACFKHSPRCRAAESSNSLRTLPFMMLHIICVLPLIQNGHAFVVECAQTGNTPNE